MYSDKMLENERSSLFPYNFFSSANGSSYKSHLWLSGMELENHVAHIPRSHMRLGKGKSILDGAYSEVDCWILAEEFKGTELICDVHLPVNTKGCLSKVMPSQSKKCGFSVWLS